jgi:hypothetical protein
MGMIGMRTLNTAARLRVIEAAVEMQRRHDAAGTLDEAAIVAEWIEARRHPRPAAPLPATIAAMTEAEAVDEFRRLVR